MSMMFILREAFDWLIRVIEFLILVRVLLSWIPINRNNSIISLVYTLTEPVLAPIRNLLFKSPLGGSGMMLDFSPIIACILLDLIRSFVLTII